MPNHPEFRVHMLNDAGKEKVIRIAGTFDQLLDTLLALCPEGRPMSLVRTKLQEACYFAKTAVAEQPENQLAAPQPTPYSGG
jgi:hypothetical protein